MFKYFICFCLLFCIQKGHTQLKEYKEIVDAYQYTLEWAELP